MPGKEDIIAGLLFIAVGIAFLAMSWAFPPGSGDGVPGPAYFPILLSLLLIGLSVLMIAVGVARKTSFDFLDVRFRANLPVFLATLGLIAAYLALWHWVPFAVNTAVFLFLLGLVFRRRLIPNLGFSVLTTAIIYGLFGNVFHVML